MYTRFGDWFAALCLLMLPSAWWRARFPARRNVRKQTVLGRDATLP